MAHTQGPCYLQHTQEHFQLPPISAVKHYRWGSFRKVKVFLLLKCSASHCISYISHPDRALLKISDCLPQPTKVYAASQLLAVWNIACFELKQNVSCPTWDPEYSWIPLLFPLSKQHPPGSRATSPEQPSPRDHACFSLGWDVLIPAAEHLQGCCRAGHCLSETCGPFAQRHDTAPSELYSRMPHRGMLVWGMHERQVLLLLIHFFLHSWLTNKQNTQGKIQETWQRQEITVCLHQAKALAQLTRWEQQHVPCPFREHWNRSFFFISLLILRSCASKLFNFQRLCHPKSEISTSQSPAQPCKRSETSRRARPIWVPRAARALQKGCTIVRPLPPAALHQEQGRVQHEYPKILRSQCSLEKDIPCFFTL